MIPSRSGEVEQSIDWLTRADQNFTYVGYCGTCSMEETALIHAKRIELERLLPKDAPHPWTEKGSFADWYFGDRRTKRAEPSIPPSDAKSESRPVSADEGVKTILVVSIVIGGAALALMLRRRG
jgi:hypothetical protein